MFVSLGWENGNVYDNLFWDAYVNFANEAFKTGKMFKINKNSFT